MMPLKAWVCLLYTSSASLNQVPCNIRDNQVVYGFDLKENQEYVLEYKIANDEKLAVEVELDEIR